MVTVSAPAKIHLIGEHTVVYGKPALLAAIDRRLYISVEETDSKKIEIVDEEAEVLVKEAIKVIKKTYQLKKFPRLRLKVSSSIPIGAGLGSSAALAVATIGALQLLLKKSWSPQGINELAYRVEKKQHGNPSGADNSVVTFGGFLWFRKEFEFLKSMWQVPIRLRQTIANKFMLVDSGRPKESTKEMVELVSSKFKVQSSKFKKIFNDQEELTKQMVLALKSADEKEIMAVIKKGEKNLEKLGVVSRKARSMIRIIEERGGVAKITGAGGVKDGSGMLICFCPKPKVFDRLIKKKGWKMMRVRLGEEGVKREKCP